MAAIEQVTAPLVIRFVDGSEKVVAACFPHSLGLLYMDLFWHQSTPNQAVHLIRGELNGDGPWRIGDARIRLLGCHNTDPHLQDQFGPWQAYLQERGEEYPPRPQILAIARRLGATIEAPAA